ncbi:transposase, partial [Streptomyces albireticuli]|uniref:transposase n=1 Tax=Streptomyces albireticuli TaxID=1940 RepID=UPI00355699C7
MAAGRGLRAAAPHPAHWTQRGRRTRLVPHERGPLPHPCEKKGEADTSPPPVDRRKTGSEHHPICDGKGTPFKAVTTAANINDITQALVLVDGIPPAAGRPSRPRRRPGSLLGDKGYDSNPNRREQRKAGDPAGHLPQRHPEHPAPGQTPLRRGTDLRPAPPVQTPR